MMDQKMKMEVPVQVREFVKKSVDQAEKAISSFMESASKSVAMAPGPMTDVAKQTLAITEANLKSSFACGRLSTANKPAVGSQARGPPLPLVMH
jgi:hypothetical protein